MGFLELLEHGIIHRYFYLVKVRDLKPENILIN